eukprot:CAMPEP_0197042152 /NCGR_PEP_ID=MMETSP1384-20130603/18582_1 /TAXON_ID=29189 /ORGANISM="Ammonia sp." /LENGTH=223 /DNA_ID=CAMNT_0042473205 /DNA_START=30 /DNA_END=701 /DNA_ORIENTATION=-
MAYQQQQQYQPYQQQQNNNNNANNDFVCFLCDKPFDDASSPTWEKWRKLDEERRAHPQCFKCDMCGQQITGKYHEKEDGSFYCLDNGCVKKFYGQNTNIVATDNNDPYQANEKYCAICNQALKSSWMADADGNKYHKECFTCCRCQKQLKDSFVRDANQLWCKECRIVIKTQEQQQINAQKNGVAVNQQQQQYQGQNSPFGQKPEQNQNNNNFNNYNNNNAQY